MNGRKLPASRHPWAYRSKALTHMRGPRMASWNRNSCTYGLSWHIRTIWRETGTMAGPISINDGCTCVLPANASRVALRSFPVGQWMYAKLVDKSLFLVRTRPADSETRGASGSSEVWWLLVSNHPNVTIPSRDDLESPNFQVWPQCENKASWLTCNGFHSRCIAVGSFL